MSQEVKENKMGILPEGRLLITMSLPMMVSMLVQALYNIADSMNSVDKNGIKRQKNSSNFRK